MYKPNGLCFSPDYKKLYICDTGSTHYPDAPKNIKVFDVVGCAARCATASSSSRWICRVRARAWPTASAPTRTATSGRARAGSAPATTACTSFRRTAQRIGMILLPEICANVCFGGPRRNRLFMAASQSLYAVYVEATGAHIA